MNDEDRPKAAPAQLPKDSTPQTGIHAGRTPDRLRRVLASEVRVEQVRFLLHERVPLGAVTLLVGDPGLGKSTWSCRLAAEVSGGRHGPPAQVLMANAEDSPAHVIVPRLAAAGADLTRVEFFTVPDGDGVRMFCLPDDVRRLEEDARDVGARLVVLDPLNAFLADGVNTHRDHSVRRALAPLAAMSQRLEIAVLVVAHLNKSDSTDALLRVPGSGLTGAARSVLLFARDPDDPDGEQGSRRALAHPKSNWGRLASTLLYAHEPVRVTVHGTTVDTHHLAYVGESAVDGRGLLGADPEDPPESQHERACELLADQLGDGEWRRSKDIKEAAKRQGLSKRTLERAAQAVVDSEKRGFPAVTWWRLALSRQADGAAVAPNHWRDSNTRGAEPNSDAVAISRAMSRGDDATGDQALGSEAVQPEVPLATDEEESYLLALNAKFPELTAEAGI